MSPLLGRSEAGFEVAQQAQHWLLQFTTTLGTSVLVVVEESALMVHDGNQVLAAAHGASARHLLGYGQVVGSSTVHVCTTLCVDVALAACKQYGRVECYALFLDSPQ